MSPSLRSAVCGALLFLSGAAQAAPMNNDDVLKMLSAGLAETLVLQGIDGAEPRFDITPEAVGKLRRAGASEAVIDRIITRTAAAVQPPAGSARGDCGLRTGVGTIGLEDGSGVREIVGEAAIAAGKQGGAGAAVLKVVTAGLADPSRPVAIIEGGRAAVRTGQHLPALTDIVLPRGLEPSELVNLVRIESKKTQRLVPMAGPKEPVPAALKLPLARDKLVTLRFDVVTRSCRSEGSPVSVFRAVPAQPLAKGEYAISFGDETLFGFGVD